MMQSNEQSPRQDLTGQEAIAKLKAIAEDARNCMFTTQVERYPQSTRPMALQTVEADGSLWFISSTDSHKNADLKVDPRVTLYFQNNSSYEFLVVHGKAMIHTDKPTIEKYWTSFANAWFDGKDDPKVSIIAVHPTDCNYWDTQDGKIMSFIKMSFQALTGVKTDDGGIEGKILV